ncbi:TonB-dependent receptor [Rudaea sp.]|uniref:TonB-dependent receptor n=1 Tax=Rudaea sp. TaxID=2136325 RepID=UPI00321FE85F
MKNTLRVKLLAGVIASALSISAYAQETTSAVAGRIVDAKGAPVAGAKVKIVHVPSGTTSNVTADANGRYQAQGLRVGGPYHIEAQGTGIKEIDADNVFLALGNTSTVNLNETTATAAQLEGVTVTANAAQVAVFNSDNKGLATNISHAQLDAAVNADGSFQNIARMDPRISVTDRDGGQISANGKNFRYNCTTVDQVNAGDPFGLESNGLQSGTTPISQETIDSYQLSTSNFDVSTRGCVGANINAVTKSGTNEFHGSLYYKYRTADDDFMGKIRQIGATQDTPYGGWKREWTSGFTVGGPILKDTLFFFLAYEKSNRVGIGAVSQPSDGGGSGALVTGITRDYFNQALAVAKQVGMNPGDLSAGANLTAKRYLAKIDWNINDQHRAVFRYNEIKESQPIPTGSTTAVAPNSNWYFKNRDPKNYLGQLFSDWTDTFSTELNLQYTHYTQLRGPLEGGSQSLVQVVNATSGFSPQIPIGTEFSSQVNALDIKSTYGYFAGTWHLGEHTVKAGVTAQQDKVYNAFLQAASGQYTYNNTGGSALTNFANGAWNAYTLNTPAPGLSLNDASAVFKKQQYGLFVQDTWQATDRLSLTYGLRYDAPRFPDSPRLNPCFAAQPGVAFTATGSDGKPICGTTVKTVAGQTIGGGFGYANNATTDGNGIFQPRVSFNYDFDTEYKTQLRGGVGVFASDVPTVWYSNSFGGSGLTKVGYSITDTSNSLPGTLLYSCNGSTFQATKPTTCTTPITYTKQAPTYGSTPMVPSLATTVPGLGAQMAVDTIDPNFQMPSTYQIALAFDRELPWMGIISSVELNYSKTLHEILYKSLNIGAATYTAADGRNFYCDPTKLNQCSTNSRYLANPSFGTVTLLTNTRQGQSNTLTWMLTKPMSDNWSANIGFRVGHATDVNPGTSSVASSNFSGNTWVNPNADVASTSNYNVAKRVIGSLTWQHKFFGDYMTRVSAFMDLHSGAPYSWISGNDTNGDGQSRDLIYIPKSIDDVVWAANNTATQKQQLLSYIQNNPYLREHMGQIAGRNAVSTPWINQIDVSFTQQIPGIFEGNKGELRFDIFNFGNLLNSKWGVEKRGAFPLTRQLANVNGIDPATGKYVFDVNQAAYKDANGNYRPQNLVVNEGQSPGVPNPSQRWSVMMTAKYTF